MALDADLLLDRRRLKRRLTFWRIVAVAAVVVAILTGLRAAGVRGERDHIVRLTVNGIITTDQKRLDAIADAERDPRVKAMILAIDSPGGGVSAGEALHDAIARFAAKKPVVAVMGAVAASAGYMIAMPADRVFAGASTLTGSIGVLLETGEISGLLGKIGVTTDTITSGPLKDQPSLTRPLTPQGREVLRGIVLDLYDQFVAMVAKGRHMTPDAVRALADGRAYTGSQALKLGLIDAIGDERDARAWLRKTKGIPAGLTVEPLRPETSLTARLLTEQLAPLFDLSWKTLISQRVRLDAPWALWQP
jgi:protease IV